MFRRLAAIGSLFLLVCIVGTWDNPPAEAARWVFVPHNCAEWEPIDHAERKTAILETLGVHRGQTLYCGIDQSDTFTAAEVFEAGKDHNQRDDTVYWGENGNFFGFTACQAGWLTDGEEGLTGCSTAAIFEFPRERVRDRDSGRRLSLRYGRVYESDGTVKHPGTNPDSDTGGYKYSPGRERIETGTDFVGVTYVWSEWVGTRNFRKNYVGSDTTIEKYGSQALAVAAAKANFAAAYATPESIKERARVGSVGAQNRDVRSDETRSVAEIAPTFVGAYWECRELGYKDVRGINAWFGETDEGDYLDTKVEQGDPNTNRASYRRRIYYEAVCWSP